MKTHENIAKILERKDLDPLYRLAVERANDQDLKSRSYHGPGHSLPERTTGDVIAGMHADLIINGLEVINGMPADLWLLRSLRSIINKDFIIRPKDSQTKIRYAVTKVDASGLRVLALSNQGRNHFDHEEDAQKHLGDILCNNSADVLRSVFGDYERMEVYPVECYQHGDAIRTVFGADDGSGAAYYRAVAEAIGEVLP